MSTHVEEAITFGRRLRIRFENIWRAKFVSRSAPLTKTKNCGAFISGPATHQSTVSTFGKVLAYIYSLLCVSFGTALVHYTYFPSANTKEPRNWNICDFCLYILSVCGGMSSISLLPRQITLKAFPGWFLSRMIRQERREDAGGAREWVDCLCVCVRQSQYPTDSEAKKPTKQATNPHLKGSAASLQLWWKIRLGNVVPGSHCMWELT